MSNTVTLTSEMAQVIASAIAPDIRAFCEAHRQEYEIFLKQYNERHSEEE